MIQWKQVANLALAITIVASVGAGAVLRNAWQVDRDFHAAWLLLSRAKTKAREDGAGPVMVRFNGPKAIVEERRGTLMAVDPNAPKVARFITLGGDAYLIRYNSRLPIVVYVPEGVEARYRIWTAGAEVRTIEKG